VGEWEEMVGERAGFSGSGRDIVARVKGRWSGGGRSGMEMRWKEWDGDGVEELRVLRGRFQQVDIRVASLSFCVRGHDLI